VRRYNGLALHKWVLNRYENLLTLFLFSTGHKSVELIRSARKQVVLIVQPLRFHYSVGWGFQDGDNCSYKGQKEVTSQQARA